MSIYVGMREYKNERGYERKGGKTREEDAERVRASGMACSLECMKSVMNVCAGR